MPRAPKDDNIARRRLEAPNGLDQKERAVWIAMVNACSAEHFIASDIPLMINYCQSYVLLQKATMELKEQNLVIVADNGKIAQNPLVSIHKSLSATISNLAMRLRLAPSTRIQTTNKAAGATAPPPRVTEGDKTDRLFKQPTH